MTDQPLAHSGRILVVEDDPVQSHAITAILRHEGFGVDVAATAADALNRLKAPSAVDVLLLDVGLPDLSGVEVVRRLRAMSQVPIILLTSRRAESDKIVGLDAGADDYVTKPFNAGELLARIRTQIRRNRLARRPDATAEHSLAAGDLTIDVGTHEVRRSGQVINLSVREFELLRILAEAVGRVVSRRHILEAVWGPEFFGDERMLDTYVRRLRKKVEPNPDQPSYLHTVRGVGYRLSAQNATSDRAH